MGQVFFVIQGKEKNGLYDVLINGTNEKGQLDKKFIPFPVTTGDVIKVIFRENNKYSRCEKVKLKRSEKEKINLIYKKLNNRGI